MIGSANHIDHHIIYYLFKMHIDHPYKEEFINGSKVSYYKLPFYYFRFNYELVTTEHINGYDDVLYWKNNKILSSKTEIYE